MAPPILPALGNYVAHSENERVVGTRVLVMLLEGLGLLIIQMQGMPCSDCDGTCTVCCMVA